MYSTKELKELIKSIDDYEPNLVLAIKQFTKSYIFKTNEELKEAVTIWCSNKDECLKKYGHISNWDVSLITDMKKLFYVKKDFNDDISRWNVSNVTNMRNMFDRAYNFNQPLNNWNVSNVTYMNGMFKEAKSFNQPLNNWNVSNVTNMICMFQEAINFKQPLNEWNVSSITHIHSIFKNINNNNLWCIYDFIKNSWNKIIYT